MMKLEKFELDLLQAGDDAEKVDRVLKSFFQMVLRFYHRRGLHEQVDVRICHELLAERPYWSVELTHLNFVFPKRGLSERPLWEGLDPVATGLSAAYEIQDVFGSFFPGHDDQEFIED